MENVNELVATRQKPRPWNNRAGHSRASTYEVPGQSLHSLPGPNRRDGPISVTMIAC
jgi:hypothetical protein